MENERIVLFISAAVEASEGKRRGEWTNFECPLCHETAVVVKSSCNGHRHAQCSGCKMSFME